MRREGEDGVLALHRSRAVTGGQNVDLVTGHEMVLVRLLTSSKKGMWLSAQIEGRRGGW